MAKKWFASVTAMFSVFCIVLLSQAVVGPTHVTWTPSAAHADTMYYEARIKNQSTGAVTQTLDLGKPDPDSITGKCKAELNTELWTAGTTYTVEVRAVLTNGRRTAWVMAAHTGQIESVTPPDTSDSIGPQASITCPAGAINIAPGSSIQTAVNANPNGTKFCLLAGTHSGQQVQPKTGNMFVGQFGAIMDGNHTAVYAFQASTSHPTGVVVKNLEIRNYQNASQQGAFRGDNGTSWTVINNSIHDNSQIGVRMGPSWVVSNNKVYRNGVIGISGYQSNGATVTNNEVYNNNLSQAPELPVNAEAAGIKFGVTSGATVSGNNVHHNYAKGIWMDHCTPTTLIEDNIITDNWHQGIFIEITYNAVVRSNTVERNALNPAGSRAGIHITNSPNVEVYNNTVRDNANGITGAQSTGVNATTGAFGPLRTENFYVHDNIVRMARGKTGLTQNTGETAVFSTWNNRFVHNTYQLDTDTAFFQWAGVNKTWAQWQTAGQDTTGSMTVF